MTKEEWITRCAAQYQQRAGLTHEQAKAAADGDVLGERRYADEFGARGGAQYFCKARAIPRVWVYRCPCCRGWHFTRKRKAERYMVTERQLLITEGVRHDDRAFS